MNYSELKEIIKQLKKIVPCTTCHHKFGNEDLQVVSTFQSEGLFYLTCRNCKNQMLVHVAIVSKKEEATTINIQAQNAGKIDPNEILDMHNFLKQFNGDFKSLFTL